MKKRKMCSLGVAFSGVLCAALLGACSQDGETAGASDENVAVESLSESEVNTETAETAETSAPAQTESETETAPVSGTASVLGTAVSDVTVEQPSENIQGTIHPEKLSNGAVAYVYVPDNSSYGLRATAAPILVVYGNTPYTSASALETAYSSGLASIADLEQGAVVFVNPVGETWGEDDLTSLEAAKNLFSDSTNNEQKISNYTQYGKSDAAAYPGSYTRLYVFGEGTGADFVYQSLSAGVDGSGQFFGNAVFKPTAALLMNPSSEESVDLTQLDGREIPVALINASEAVVSSYEALNQTTETLVLTSDVSQGFDADIVTEAYDQVMEHYMVRVQSSVGVEDCQTSLLRIGGNEELGLTETKNDYEFSDGSVLTYYQWVDGDENQPLVLAFHGSGSSAENLVWSSGFNDLAASEGFNLVSFENYSNENLDNAKIMEAVDHIIAETASDSTKVYVSGFSMGSMRTWALASQYSDRFAGAIAMNGFNSGMEEGAEFKTSVPFYAIGGKESYLAAFFEFPGADNYVQEAALFKVNNVSDNFVFDETAGVWGMEPAETYTITAEDLPDLTVEVSLFADSDGNVMTAFASASSAGHEPLRSATADGWNFVSQFSRNSDGSLSVDGEN